MAPRRRRRAAARALAGAQPVPPSGGTVEVDRIWGLPERLHQPEGLVVTGDWDVLVATDHQQPRDNLFLLDGLGP